MAELEAKNTEELLNWDEELDIEQAREDIKSLESEVLVAQPKNYDYYNDVENGIDSQSYLKTFNYDRKPDNVHYLTHTDSQSNETEGEPMVELVNNINSISGGNQFMNQYNPYTRTFFKCSIYSPSNRLYTVDEVNSTISENDHSSHFVFSNKNQDSMNMTNSMIVPWTPTPKVKKVMRTQKIRTKTGKQIDKFGMTLCPTSRNPTSAKFLFRTMSSLPSNSSKENNSPSVNLSSLLVRNEIAPAQTLKVLNMENWEEKAGRSAEKSSMKSTPSRNCTKENLTTNRLFHRSEVPRKQKKINKIIKLSGKNKTTSKPKATRNVSRGDISKLMRKEGYSDAKIAKALNADIRKEVRLLF